MAEVSAAAFELLVTRLQIVKVMRHLSSRHQSSKLTAAAHFYYSMRKVSSLSVMLGLACGSIPTCSCQLDGFGMYLRHSCIDMRVLTRFKDF